MQYLINGFRGFCMALADSVPGVSGGTIAFILGFYDQFVIALNNIIFGSKLEKKEAFFFLMKLGIGWILGMIIATLILTSLFEKHIYSVSSLFLGFIIFSIPLMINAEKNCLKGKYKNIVFLLLGVMIVSLITYLNPVSGGNGINITNLNISLAIYIFISAMIAISAMVLPGISGSTLLLIFGLYMPIMNAIKSFIHLDFSYFKVLFIFGLGILTGIILVIKLIKIALEKFRSQMVYMIIGLMIGSLYAIIMGPTTLETPQNAMNLSSFSIIWFIIGGIIILGLENTKKVFNKKNNVV